MNTETKKDTIFPVKFYKNLTIEEIDLFQGICSEFARSIKTDVAFISFSAVAKRLQTINESEEKCKYEKSCGYDVCLPYECSDFEKVNPKQ